MRAAYSFTEHGEAVLSVSYRGLSPVPISPRIPQTVARWVPAINAGMTAGGIIAGEKQIKIDARDESMVRIARVVFVAAVSLVAFAPLAHAGLPRGAMLSADEQDADETTGVTIARGHAEISIAAQRIFGHADTIELRPRGNQIVFKGGAQLRVGSARYEGEAVTCTLDFFKCETGAPADESGVPIPNTQRASAPTEIPQPMPAPSGVGAAVINPR